MTELTEDEPSPVDRDILKIVEAGHSLRERCEAIIEALSGIEADARELRRAVKEVRRTFPARPRERA